MSSISFISACVHLKHYIPLENERIKRLNVVFAGDKLSFPLDLRSIHIRKIQLQKWDETGTVSSGAGMSPGSFDWTGKIRAAFTRGARLSPVHSLCNCSPSDPGHITHFERPAISHSGVIG